VKARLGAAAIAVLLASPTSGLAGDNPWAVIKDMFHEPVSELKQQLKQLRPPAKARTAPKPKASSAAPETAAEVDSAPAPIPIARPAAATLASHALEDPTPPPAATPPQGNSPILVDQAGATSASVEDGVDADPDTDVSASGPVEGAGHAAGASVVADTDVAVAGPVPPVGKVLPPPTAEEPDEFETALTPIPRPRPENVIAFAAVGPEPSASKSAAAIGALVAPLAKPPPAARSTCGISLAKLGVEAKPIAPISEGVCGIPEPVAVAALDGGAIDLTAKAIIGCQLAETFANWLEDDVQPAARELLGGDVVGLRVAASYACRTRNGVPGAKLSEHAHGNAIDISAFNVAGRGWIEVGGIHGLGEARFLGTIRKSACGPFKTVLGPGSDANHSNHFHLDLAQRSKRGRSRGLYCQ
jgi:hypothetical protein